MPTIRGKLLGLPKKKQKVQPEATTTLETERDLLPDEVTMPKEYFNPTIYNNPDDLNKKKRKFEEFKKKSYVLDELLK